MLYDPETPSYVDLESFPGKIILRVPFRKDWEEEEEFLKHPMHGQEGVFMDTSTGLQSLKPFEETKWETLFDITPDRKQLPDDNDEPSWIPLQYLIRWWHQDVFIPTTKTCFVRLRKLETTWEFRSSGITLYGLKLYD